MSKVCKVEIEYFGEEHKLESTKTEWLYFLNLISTTHAVQS